MDNSWFIIRWLFLVFYMVNKTHAIFCHNKKLLFRKDTKSCIRKETNNLNLIREPQPFPSYPHFT